MKAYKITLLFLDHDDVGPTEAKELIENARLPNHIQPGTVMQFEERDIGEWHDEHPLNRRDTMEAAYLELFPLPVSEWQCGEPIEKATSPQAQYKIVPHETPDEAAHTRPWHSPKCYAGGSHISQDRCTCGLTALRTKLDILREDIDGLRMELATAEKALGTALKLNAWLDAGAGHLEMREKVLGIAERIELGHPGWARELRAACGAQDEGATVDVADALRTQLEQVAERSMSLEEWRTPRWPSYQDMVHSSTYEWRMCCKLCNGTWMGGDRAGEQSTVPCVHPGGEGTACPLIGVRVPWVAKKRDADLEAHNVNYRGWWSRE
jgi:hypothetical protein